MKRRVLHTDTLSDRHQSAKSFQIVDCSKRGEVCGQLKAEKPVAVKSELFVASHDFRTGPSREAKRLEHDWCAAMRLDCIHSLDVLIGPERVSLLIGDECTGDERAIAQNGSSLPKGFVLSCVIEQMHVARVHVDGGGQSRFDRSGNMRGKCGPVDLTRFQER